MNPCAASGRASQGRGQDWVREATTLKLGFSVEGVPGEGELSSAMVVGAVHPWWPRVLCEAWGCFRRCFRCVS